MDNTIEKNRKEFKEYNKWNYNFKLRENTIKIWLVIGNPIQLDLQKLMHCLNIYKENGEIIICYHENTILSLYYLN